MFLHLCQHLQIARLLSFMIAPGVGAQWILIVFQFDFPFELKTSFHVFIKKFLYPLWRNVHANALPIYNFLVLISLCFSLFFCREMSGFQTR